MFKYIKYLHEHYKSKHMSFYYTNIQQFVEI